MKRLVPSLLAVTLVSGVKTLPEHVDFPIHTVSAIVSQSIIDTLSQGIQRAVLDQQERVREKYIRIVTSSGQCDEPCAYI